MRVPQTTGGLAPVGLVTVRKSVPVGHDPKFPPDVGGAAVTRLSKSSLQGLVALFKEIISSVVFLTTLPDLTKI